MLTSWALVVYKYVTNWTMSFSLPGNDVRVAPANDVTGRFSFSMHHIRKTGRRAGTAGFGYGEETNKHTGVKLCVCAF